MNLLPGHWKDVTEGLLAGRCADSVRGAFEALEKGLWQRFDLGEGFG